MVDAFEFILSFTYFLLRLFHAIRKAMAVCSNPPAARASPPPPLVWKRFTTDPPVIAHKRSTKEAASDRKQLRPAAEDHDQFVEPILVSFSKKSVPGCPRENLVPAGRQEVSSTPKEADQASHEARSRAPQNFALKFAASISAHAECENGNLGCEEECGRPMVQAPELHSPSPRMSKVEEEKKVKAVLKARRRPPRLVIPDSGANSDFDESSKMTSMAVPQEQEVEGSDYCVASRRGHRHVMEDGYGVITNIHGDSKQAFFGVFDGHGGRAAVDFVSEKLGKNIITALDKQGKGENQLERALRAGYLTTDREFLSKGFSSGACAATVLLKDGELHVANVGDCRVVISQKGVANALTSDHRAGREDERNRIESSGGYVSSRNGVWRVQDSLAVSRAIGDGNMKEWIISEPETRKLRLKPDCEFLIMASDGLWDKVTNQEAVDVVLRHKNSKNSCKDLIDISCSRGNRDDITVMVVDLQNFVQLG